MRSSQSMCLTYSKLSGRCNATDLSCSLTRLSFFPPEREHSSIYLSAYLNTPQER